MTTDRDDPDATSATPDEFWGEQTEWTPQPPPVRGERGGLGAAVGRWWAGLAGGNEHAARVHGEPRERSHDHHDDSVPLAGAPLDEDAWDLEPEPVPSPQPGIDPLIARLGGLAVVITLAAPLLLGITASGADSGSESGSDPGNALPTAVAAQSTVTGSAESQENAESSATDASGVAATPPPSGSAVESDASVATPPAPAGTSEVAQLDTGPAPDDAPAATTPATASAPAAATTVAACGDDYELAAGDYWIRIADAAGVPLADLLDVNDASVDTVLVPGRSICLPAGASTPAPPTTVTPSAPPTRAPTTAVPSSSGTTTQAPSTTAPRAPTTTSPPRPAAVPESEATAIIREVWPDELEERALEIAWRESNHRSNVNNFCCYGLFQIHFSVHRSWLAPLGIDSADDLFDPRLNSIAAYTLYQRAGGWGPWGG
jgi:LysM repeat protein